MFKGLSSGCRISRYLGSRTARLFPQQPLIRPETGIRQQAAEEEKKWKHNCCLFLSLSPNLLRLTHSQAGSKFSLTLCSPFSSSSSQSHTMQRNTCLLISACLSLSFFRFASLASDGLRGKTEGMRLGSGCACMSCSGKEEERKKKSARSGENGASRCLVLISS